MKQTMRDIKGTRDRQGATIFALLLLAAFLLTAPPVRAQDDAKIAQQLSNPVANLISIPLQSNWDFGIGPKDATRYTLNIQPVIPFSINQDFNLITRTIVPIIHAQETAAGLGDHSGLGDILQSFFFSPKKPTSSGLIWGAGPVVLYPSGGDGLSAEKLGVGPTAVVLKQEHGWTYGILANHLWSVAGGGEREVSATFLQPFVSYTTSTHTTFGVNTESTYNWEMQEWTVPLNASISQLVRIGGLPIQFQLGGRTYAQAPDGGPDWGLRFTVTFLFPTGGK